MELPTQYRHVITHILQSSIRNDTDLAIFQCDRVGRMSFLANSIHPQNLARHAKSGYLITAIFQKQSALEKAASDCIKRAEFVTTPIKAVSALDLPSGINEIVDAIHFRVTQSARQT